MYYRIATKTGELHLVNLNQACRIVRQSNTVRVFFTNKNLSKASNDVVFTYANQASATKEFNKLTSYIAPSLIGKPK
jgi:hypothetical protein